MFPGLGILASLLAIRGHTTLLLVAWIAVGLLLFAITATLVTTRMRATAMADNMTVAARNSEAKLVGIIQSAMDAVITIDDAQRIVLFNPAAEAMFGIPATQAMGTLLTELMPERFRVAHRGHVSRFGRTGVTERAMGGNSAIYGVRAAGKEFPIEASISQLAQGGQKLYTVILRDITRRKHAEQELNESHRRLRELSASLQRAREDEKTRIARELHDDLGQRLTALKMDVATLQDDIPDDLASLRHTAEGMNHLIDSTVAAVRRIAADLRPVMLDDLGLASAVEWLTSEFTRRHGIKTILAVSDEDVEFDHAAATAIYRLVQEALTNVARHAQASEVTVALHHESTQDIVTVSDNGKGMGPEDEGKAGSFGLLGMKERAHLLGGTMTIASKPSEGTTIRIIIPRIGKVQACKP
jgi:PAS domain S-box-containing protein